jgi:hypothetical protein
MNNRKMTYGLVAFYMVAVFLTGCIPEDSLEWSEDGSVGLLRVEGALYLVNGQTGDLTEIARENVQMLPDISKDGNLVAYSQKAECNSLSEGLKLLPPGQVKLIEYYAEQARKLVLDAGGLVNDEFSFPDEGLLTPHDYRNWAIRYLCENADSKLLEILGEEGIKKGKEKKIHYTQVVVVRRKALDERQIVAINLFNTMAIKLSPNGKHVAYLMHTQKGQVSNSPEEYALYVAQLKGDIKAMLIDHGVAFGYDWSKDATAIAYLDADSEDLRNEELILGTFKERLIAEANGSLLAKPLAVPQQGSVQTHNCTGKTASLAGVIFYPWLKVQYGSGDRIFFSSCLLSLPTSKRDNPRWSLFCYDSVIATVTDVLPLNVSNYTSQATAMAQFALSPDGKNVLLPIKNNRFLCYELGTDSMEIPIEENEVFGEEDGLELAPSWKGNDHVSFLVSENSHFLVETKQGSDKPARKEMVILRKTDGQSWILSEGWPDEAIP